MIIYFRKGVRSIELLLAKNTLRPGMLTNGYIFMVIESDARGHLGIMPSEREYFDLGWMASAAFWTRAKQLLDDGWDAEDSSDTVIRFMCAEAIKVAEKKKRASQREAKRGGYFAGRSTSQGAAANVAACFSRTPRCKSIAVEFAPFAMVWRHTGAKRKGRLE